MYIFNYLQKAFVAFANVSYYTPVSLRRLLDGFQVFIDTNSCMPCTFAEFPEFILCIRSTEVRNKTTGCMRDRGLLPPLPTIPPPPSTGLPGVNTTTLSTGQPSPVSTPSPTAPPPSSLPPQGNMSRPTFPPPRNHTHDQDFCM